MLIRGESLTWGNREAPSNVEDRAEHAITEWSQYWKGQEGYTQQKGEQLPPITGNRVRRVLKHMSAHKAKGMDHWGPDELRKLPEHYTNRLAGILNDIENKENGHKSSGKSWSP